MIVYREASSLIELAHAHTLLRGIDAFYPDFDNWFVNKCMPAVVSGTDTMIVAEEHARLVGVALVKNATDEKKLRCVRVNPEFNGKGVALHLIDRALKVLGESKPATSVPEDLINSWSRILVNRFDFNLNHVSKGDYRKGKLEYYFNTQKEAPTGVGETTYGRE